MKGLKFINASILAILISIGFVACSGDNDSDDTKKVLIENFSQGNLTFTEQSNEQSFSFTANSSWTVTVSSNGGDTSWCTVYPSSGEKGTQTVRVSTTANTSYDNRNATITLTSGTQTKSFVVTQKQKDALLLTSDKFEIDKAGGTITVEVKSNVSYTATIGNECKDWIKEGSGTRGLTTTTKIYTISPSEETDKREGTITFTDGTLSETVHVYQTGGYSVILNNRSCVIDENGGPITVELRSNCDYDVIMPDVDWIKEDKTRAMSSHTLYDSREAIIIYKDKKDLVRDTLTVTQAQLNAVVLVDKSLSIGSVGGTVEAKVKSNVSYDVVMPDVDWISRVPKTRGLTESVEQFTVAQNSGDDGRSTEIIFKSKDGATDTLNVTQTGNITVITIKKLGTLSQLCVNKERRRVKIVGPVYSSELQSNLSSSIYCDLSEATIYDADGSKWESFRAYVNPEYVSPGTFLFEDKAETIIMPNDLNKISGLAFGKFIYKSGSKLYFHANLKEIVFSSILTSIGSDAFPGTGLTNITIPEGVETVGYSAFEDCSSLENVEVLGTTEISNSEFKNCTNLKSVYLNPKITSIGQEAFAKCSSIRNIEIPSGVTRIGNSAFSECESLTEISIPNGVKEIGEYTFNECTALTEVKLPNGISKIGEKAFYYCNKLSTISLPDSLKEIGERAFYGCSSLTNVTLPKGLISIESYAFENCGYKTISIPSSVTKIGVNAFTGSKFTTCYIYAKTPPACTVSTNLMSFVVASYVDSKLYVPKGCLEAYKDWAYMFYDIYEMEE
jgi:hypothetical protein